MKRPYVGCRTCEIDLRVRALVMMVGREASCGLISSAECVALLCDVAPLAGWVTARGGLLGGFAWLGGSHLLHRSHLEGEAG